MRRDTDGSNRAREAALVAQPVTRIDPIEYQRQEREERAAPTKLATDKPKDAKAVIPARPVGSNPTF